jgi:preprotein translocase subunit Sec63
VAVLSVFFIILLIIIPGSVFWWYSENSQYDEKGIPNQNKINWYQFLNENLISKNCPEILAVSQEFSIDVMPCKSPQEEQELQKLLKSDILNTIPKPKIDRKYYKALILILAYMQGVEIPDILRKDLAVIQKRFPKLIRVILLI